MSAIVEGSAGRRGGGHPAAGGGPHPAAVEGDQTVGDSPQKRGVCFLYFFNNKIWLKTVIYGRNIYKWLKKKLFSMLLAIF